MAAMAPTTERAGLGSLGMLALSLAIGACARPAPRSQPAALEGDDAGQGQGRNPMTQHEDPATAPALSLKLVADLTGPYGARLAFDAAGKRWALADHQTIQLGEDGQLGRLLTAPEEVHELRWSADGQQLYAAPLVYDVARDAWQARPSLDAAMAEGLDAPPDPQQLGVVAAAMSSDGKDLVIATRFQPTRRLGGKDHYKGPHERLLAVSASGAPRGVLYAGPFEMRALAIGDRMIAAGGAPVLVWERASLRKVAELPHELVARALAFSPGGDRLAVLTADGDVSLWDPTAGKLLGSFHAHRGDGYTLAFHPTLPLLATGGQDGVLRVWSIAADSMGASRYAETVGGWVQAVAFAPTGTRLAAVTRARPPHLLLYELAAP